MANRKATPKVKPVALTEDTVKKITEDALENYYRNLMPDNHVGEVTPKGALRSLARRMLTQVFEASMLRILGFRKDTWARSYELEYNSPFNDTIKRVVGELYQEDLAEMVKGLKVPIPAAVSKLVRTEVRDALNELVRDSVEARVNAALDEKVKEVLETELARLTGKLPTEGDESLPPEGDSESMAREEELDDDTE